METLTQVPAPKRGITNLGLVFTGLIVAAAFMGNTYVKGQSDLSIKNSADSLSITGTSERTVESDRVKWSIRISQRSPYNAYNGYDDYGYALPKPTTTQPVVATKPHTTAEAIEGLRKILKDAHVEADFSVQPLNDGYYGGGIQSQVVVIESSNTGAIGDIASTAQNKLGMDDITLATERIEYFYTKLADLKKDLAREAINDARDQASTYSQGHVGNLQKMAAPVYAVTSETSGGYDYGYGYSYEDTSSIKKKVKATINAEYHLN